MLIPGFSSWACYTTGFNIEDDGDKKSGLGPTTSDVVASSAPSLLFSSSGLVVDNHLTILAICDK